MLLRVQATGYTVDAFVTDKESAGCALPDDCFWLTSTATMASQAAYQAEKVIGHGDNAVTQQDVTSYDDKTGKPGETMKALAWMGKNKVKMGTTHNTLT